MTVELTTKFAETGTVVFDSWKIGVDSPQLNDEGSNIKWLASMPPVQTIKTVS